MNSLPSGHVIATLTVVRYAGLIKQLQVPLGGFRRPRQTIEVLMLKSKYLTLVYDFVLTTVIN